MNEKEQASLEEIFFNNKDRLIHKYDCYFPVYERYFSKYRNKPLVILEIGVYQGGSLQMWKKYFGKQAEIYGIDINPQCKSLEEENIHIFIGSQSDRAFLRKLKEEIPKVDILIDDGGHTMKQQIVTFEELFDHVKEDGIYLCEDCHTSYWNRYGGGLKRRGSYMEYMKNLVDKLTAWHFDALKVDSFTKSVRSIAFYDSIVVVEKEKMKTPKGLKVGKPSFEIDESIAPFDRLKFNVKLKLDAILNFFHLPTIMRM